MRAAAEQARARSPIPPAARPAPAQRLTGLSKQSAAHMGVRGGGDKQCGGKNRGGAAPRAARLRRAVRANGRQGLLSRAAGASKVCRAPPLPPKSTPKWLRPAGRGASGVRCAMGGAGPRAAPPAGRCSTCAWEGKSQRLRSQMTRGQHQASSHRSEEGAAGPWARHQRGMMQGEARGARGAAPAAASTCWSSRMRRGRQSMGNKEGAAGVGRSVAWLLSL